MAGTVALMVGLNAAQARDAQDERVRESSQLTDDSGLGETRASPLQLPQRSYTQATEDEIDGLPSTVMGMQEQRQREERMKATAEQFAGAPTTPTVGAPAEETQEGAEAKRRKAARVEEQKEEEEAPSAGDYYANQQREAKKTWSACGKTANISGTTATAIHPGETENSERKMGCGERGIGININKRHRIRCFRNDEERATYQSIYCKRHAHSGTIDSTNRSHQLR